MKAFTGGHVKTTGTVKLNLIDKVNKIGVLSALQEFQSKEWNCGDWLLLVTAYDAGHFLFLLFGGDDGIGATVLVIIFNVPPASHESKACLFLQALHSLLVS